MSRRPDVLQILQEERERWYPQVPANLVEEVYRIAERTQFREERAEAQGRIAERVGATVEREDVSSGDAS